MTTYNFTVRATDNLGAYADRQFGVTVNNTNVAKFVAAGSTNAYSYDGINWVTGSISNCVSVAYGNGYWYMTTANGTYGTIYISSDGVNWAAWTGSYSTNGYGNGANRRGMVRYLPNINKMAFGDDASGAIMYLTADGSTTAGGSQAAIYTVGSNVAPIIGIARLGGYNYGIAPTTAAYGGGVARTTDTNLQVATAWTNVLDSSTSGYPNISGQHGGGIKCYNGMLFAYSTAGLWNSIDGTNWNKRISATGVHSVCYGNGVLLAIPYSSANTVYRSTDGVNWSSITVTGGYSSSSGLAQLAFYNGTWVWAQDGGGAYLYSTNNGTTWSTVAGGFSNGCKTIESRLPMNSQ
jgi:hypothetical protein